jgi:DNA-binding transcriptional LysR family regulator
VHVYVHFCTLAFMTNARADDLLYLLELARAGRLVQAAHRLGVEHTTVSRRIAALESAVGRRLVHRTANRWLLTDDGEQLLAHAETIESTMHAVSEHAVNRRSTSLGGTVRVAATDGIGGTLVAQALVALRRRHPRLEIELTTATRRFDVTYKDYDVAITLQRFRSRRFLVRHLTNYRLDLYATQRYLENHPRITRREDLAEHTFAWYVESLLEVPELDIFEEHVAARPVLRSSNIFAQLGFVLAGGGIGLLPRFLTMDRPELEPVLPNEVSVQRTMWLVVRKESLNLARVHATVDQLTAHITAARDRLTGPIENARR